jgi:hypothetical protein
LVVAVLVACEDGLHLAFETKQPISDGDFVHLEGQRVRLTGGFIFGKEQTAARANANRLIEVKARALEELERIKVERRSTGRGERGS